MFSVACCLTSQITDTESEEILVYFNMLLFYNICSDMTDERSYYSDTRCSNQMEDNHQHWTSPEDGHLLGRNA